ncbi:MAG: hypothetical protein KatS3mg111_0908 [Pirellulaceae bacterium]|nr:MAG: hypothetical protein KatS3mg111_0908 [Pirellulaceae bacterium]
MKAPPQRAEDAEAAVALLTALFDQHDLILFRPIETWTEAGRKRSRVDFRNVCYRPAKAVVLRRTVELLFESSAAGHTNLFFGVCPRAGDKGRFDFAWQIRQVRTLWADIDDCSSREALARCRQSELPQPSAVVNSGHGVHLYWSLDAPYLIDDVGDPPPVETEWTQTPDGRKRPRRYLVEDGDRVYLDQRQHIWQVSPKAQHIQDLLAGVANAVGGDHTTDLARLLRLPGSMNRKDQRNGRDPHLNKTGGVRTFTEISDLRV